MPNNASQRCGYYANDDKIRRFSDVLSRRFRAKRQFCFDRYNERVMRRRRATFQPPFQMPTSMERTLEPESMDSHEEATEYEEMDHSVVNRIFVDDLLAGGEVGTYLIDLGCGPAAIPIELCERLLDVKVIGVDSSIAMLEAAKIQVDFAGLLDRICLEQGDAKDISDFQGGNADTVISNSLLHHLSEPELGLKAAIYLLSPGGRIFFRDLARPTNEAQVEGLVDQYCSDETEFARQLFRQSLHAALSLDEIRHIARGLGINEDHVQMTSDRHWTIDWRDPSKK